MFSERYPLHYRTSLRTWTVVCMLLASCAGTEPTVCSLPDGLSCNGCFSSEHRCEYDDVVVVERACDGCQARVAMYEELCAAGRQDTLEAVDLGMTCMDVPAE